MNERRLQVTFVINEKGELNTNINSQRVTDYEALGMLDTAKTQILGKIMNNTKPIFKIEGDGRHD